jgi:hypothetical protein
MIPTWILITLSLLNPFLVFAGVFTVLEYRLPHARHPRGYRAVSLAGESVALTVPPFCLYAANWITMSTLLVLLFTILGLFRIALYIHNGNDVESFMMMAMLAIVLCHFVCSAGFAYQKYRSRTHSNQSPDNQMLDLSGGPRIF